MGYPTRFTIEEFKQWLEEDNHTKLFEEELSFYLHQFDYIFNNTSQMKYFHIFIKGLFSSLDRKSLKAIALHFLDKKAVRGFQQFLTRSSFSLEDLSSVYCSLLAQQLSHPSGMIFVKDIGFIKKGIHSAGVGRQYYDKRNKIENCQIGVFLTYASDLGCGILREELFLPQDWFQPSYQERKKECQIPEERHFAAKSQIALELLYQTLQENLLDVQWVGCDTAYGSDPDFLEHLVLPKKSCCFASIHAAKQVFLEYPNVKELKNVKKKRGKQEVLFVSSVTVQSIADDPNIPWEPCFVRKRQTSMEKADDPNIPWESGLTRKQTIGMEKANNTNISWEGCLGMEGGNDFVDAERKCIRCYISHSEEYCKYSGVGEAVWLYLRKEREGTIRYFLSNAPETIPIEELDHAAVLWLISGKCLEECNRYLGMGDYECRSYPAWKRHMQFVQIAHLFLTKIKRWN